jgi:type III secretion protein T
MAISLPQAWLTWQFLLHHPPGTLSLLILGFKEAVLGLVLGVLLSLPYWTVQSAGTLIDNQRGGNAAQNINPSMAADASLLGELAQRTLIAVLIEAGLFVLMFDVIADSYKLWPVMDGWPKWGQHSAVVLVRMFQSFISDSIIYSGPALLLLLAVEFGMAISSSSVKGLDVYQTAMPIKSQLSLVMLALYFGLVLNLMLDTISAQWGGGLLILLGKI